MTIKCFNVAQKYICLFAYHQTHDDRITAFTFTDTLTGNSHFEMRCVVI